jgi:hypothetical protein
MSFGCCPRLQGFTIFWHSRSAFNKSEDGNNKVFAFTLAGSEHGGGHAAQRVVNPKEI